MTLDTAACGLGGPAKHSAGCCFPVSEFSEGPQQGFPRPSLACWCQCLWLAPGRFAKVNPWLENPPLQLPPLATAAFATFLACLLPKCLLGLKLLFFYGSESDVRQCGLWPDNQLKNPGLEKPTCSFYPLPHLLLPRSWPA